jgi:hypothetical protein
MRSTQPEKTVGLVFVCVDLAFVLLMDQIRIYIGWLAGQKIVQPTL